jgi:hypothetical protein
MGNPNTEINLSELEDWYLTQLESIYSKHHKILRKFFKKAGDEVAQTKAALKNWTTRKPAEDEEKLDDKTKRIMQRFLQNVDESLDRIEIPTYHTKISYVNSRKFVDGVQKLYQTYNAEGKKALKRFWKSFQLEIKEVDLHLRKLGNYSTKINQFLLRKYTDGKEAENLLKNIPQLEHYIERLGQSKVKIDGMDKEFVNMQEFLKQQEEDLFELSKNADIQKLEKLEQQNMRLDRDFRTHLKFKKALKKLEKGLERKNVISRDLAISEVKKYLKTSVDGIINEGPKVSGLKQVLIKTRIILEDEKHPLNLKADLREKILENIHEIVNEDKLGPLIEELRKLRNEIHNTKKIIEKAGIASRRQELKEKIAILTADRDHFENDLKHLKRDYKTLLSKISTSRTELQKEIKNQTDLEIKINIIIPT